MFLLVPAYPGCPGSKAVKRSLLLLMYLTRGFLVPPESMPANDTSIGLAVFVGLMVVTDKWTDTHTQTDRHKPWNNGNNRPHLMLCIVVWPKQ